MVMAKAGVSRELLSPLSRKSQGPSAQSDQLAIPELIHENLILAF
jgi:hypothetical protein